MKQSRFNINSGWAVETINESELKEGFYNVEGFVLPKLIDGVLVEQYTSEQINALISENKINKIAELKANANAKFQETNWYYERENRLSRGGRPLKPVPQEIVNQDMAVYDTVDLKEAEINALTTLEEVNNYDVSI